MISVIISTFSRRAMLGEAVASVQAQSLQEWELLIVDDASTDDTWEWLSSLRDERIRVYRQTVNQERSAARNRGLADARGEFVMFLDDDDRLLPEGLRLLQDALRARPSAIAAAGGKINFAPGFFSIRMPHTPVTVFREIWPELVAWWSAVPGQCLFRIEIVRAVGGFRLDVNVVEDRQLWMDIARLGPVVVIPDYVMEYRQHTGQWKPSNVVELRELVLLRFYDTLPEEELARAQKYRRSGVMIANHGDKVMSYVRAMLLTPSLFLSPLTGPIWWRGFAKALVAPVWKPRPLWEGTQPTGDPKKHAGGQDDA
jgi:glycosyltransferase involved in cell wall biosynthesis